MLLTLVLAFAAPIKPWLIQHAIDHYILIPNSKRLLQITLLMAAILFMESGLQFYTTYLTNWLGQSIIRDLRIKIYNHILKFRIKYFDNTPIGTLVTRAISDIETISDVFSEGVMVIFGDILQLTVVVLVMFLTDWRLALISLCSIPVLIIATYFFKKAIKAAFQDVRSQVAKLNAFVQEHLTGMSIVQIFNQEETELKKFTKINERHKQAHLQTVWIFSIFFPVVEMLSAVSLGLVIWWGSNGVLSGIVTLGNLVAFILYIYMLFRPIRQLADRFNTLQMGMVGSERVFRVLDTDERIDDSGIKNALEINGPASGGIEFKNVWFAYNDNQWVLKDISFKINDGELLAIVGATGAGKSSIINLLSRFYEINKGAIMIDGISSKEFTIESLRKSIAVVLQDVFLFSDSIINNITLGQENISREAVISAAKEVGIHDFIELLPGGYDFDVRERGGMLSTGQRQLIAFLRAYMYNPKILVLDEATSSVDSESENLIRQAMQRLTANRTSIIIAHRLSTIQAADKIMVMDHGKIAEMGNHTELIELNGIYKKLYEFSKLKESMTIG